MNFTHLLGNENIIKEAYDAVHPVEEGWGVVASWLVGGWLPTLVTYSMSSSTLEKLLRNPKLSKYIVNVCKVAFAKEKKLDKSVILKNPHTFMERLKAGWHGTDHMTMWERWAHYGFLYTLGKFYIIIFCDTDHIQTVRAIFYSQEKDEYISSLVPAPSRKDLGFYDEE